MNMDFGAMEDLDETTTEKINRVKNPSFLEDYGRVSSNKCFLPKYFSEFAKEIANFEVRDDDVWCVSFMKTGTTWLKELIWLIVNNCNFIEAKRTVCYTRFPNFESSATVRALKSKLDSSYPTSMELLRIQKSQRLIHSHLPWTLLPMDIQLGSRQPKIIYITRNPMDAAVSFFHHAVLFEGFLGTLDDFVDLFVNDAVRYAPFQNHVYEFWNRRYAPNILFLGYEEMIMDIASVADKIADFLGKQIIPTTKPQLLEYLHFDNMKVNPAVNNESLIERFVSKHGVRRQSDFIRRGKVGSWMEELSPEARKKLYEWYLVNRLNEIGDWQSIME